LIIKNFFFDILKNLLSRYDLIIVKKNIIDFNKNFNLSKLKLSNQNIVKNFKISNLITTAGKRLGSFEDPYYFALKKSLPIKNKKSFTISFVKKIKFIVKSPRTASEAIKLIKSKKLSLYPEWALVLPWEDISIEENYNTYMNIFFSKRKKLKKLGKYIRKKERDKIIYHNLAWESHAEQYYNLYNKMIKKGFKKINYIPAYLFRYKNQFRFSLADDGNHRIRTAYVLGFKSIPLKILKIVDLENLNNWLNVKNGLYTRKEAKKIFINYFNYKGSGSYV
jgi:hypothetical protein